MKRLVSIYGAIAGVIIILGVIATIELDIAYMWLGYLIMFIAFSAIFVAVKQYRDESLGGSLRFLSGLLVGLGITIVASVIYVLVWEVYLLLTDYAYMDDYVQSMIAARQAAGVSEAELSSFITEMEALVAQYSNPVFRLPITFLEVFPPGFLVSLLAASVLKKNVAPAEQ